MVKSLQRSPDEEEESQLNEETRETKIEEGETEGLTHPNPYDPHCSASYERTSKSLQVQR